MSSKMGEIQKIFEEIMVEKIPKKLNKSKAQGNMKKTIPRDIILNYLKPIIRIKS